MPLLDISGVLSKPTVESVYAVCNNCSRITVIINQVYNSQISAHLGGSSLTSNLQVLVSACSVCVCVGVCRCTSGHTASVKGGMVSVD